MQDVTDIFQYYRLCLRDVWNRCFWSDHDLRTYASGEHFERIVPLLFQALVLERLEWPEGTKIHSQDKDVEEFFDLFQVVPALPTMDGEVKSARITILSYNNWDYTYLKNPIAGRAGSEETLKVTSTEVDLRFLNFFEWATIGYRDLRYYVAKIHSFSSRPHLVGREVIVDVEEVKVFFNQPNTIVS